MIQQRDDEGPEAYAGFCAYVNLPPSNRSIIKAIESSGKQAAKVRRLWETWSARYDWVARAREADGEAAAEVRQALVDRQVTIATVGAEKLIEALRLVDPADIAKRPGYVPRWIESVGSLSRLLGGLPTAITENREADNEAAAAYREFMAGLEARAQAVAVEARRLPDD
jgi:hypothetical protein